MQTSVESIQNKKMDQIYWKIFIFRTSLFLSLFQIVLFGHLRKKNNYLIVIKLLFKHKFQIACLCRCTLNKKALTKANEMVSIPLYACKNKVDFFTSGCFIYILDSSNSSSFTFSSLLALEATELASEPGTQMAVDLINILVSFQYGKSDECKTYILFHVKTTSNRFWNDAEMLWNPYELVICEWWIN